MHSEWSYLIYLYVCGAASVSAEAPKEAISWQILWSLAQQQAITGVIAHALRRSPALDCPADIRNEATSFLLGNALSNTAQQEAVLRIIAMLEHNGLHPAVLKGMDVARFYAYPECRSSADTDLLLPAQEEEAALRLLAQAGFQIERRSEQTHHSSCFRADTGLLELHGRLWSTVAEQGVFAGRGAALLPLGSTRHVPFAGTQLPVLQETDALLFLAMHLIKHFAVQGTGVRMAYDFTLYYASNRAHIDRARFWRVMEQLGFAGIVGGIFGIFVRWGGFSAQTLDAPHLPDEQTCRLLLEDFANYSTAEVIDVSLINEAWVLFCKRTARRTGKGYRLRMALRRLGTRVQLLFPSAKVLAVQYPYLSKHCFLYPVAFTQRFFAVLCSKERRRATRVLHDPRTVTGKTQQRAALFEALGI